MLSTDPEFWKEAVNDEMDSILSNNTWVLVDLPQGSNQYVISGYLEENIPRIDLY